MEKVRDGYKMTELGEIPKEWQIKSLSEIAYKIGDGLHGTPTYNEDGEYYFINGNNLTNGKILMTNETKSVCESEYSKYKKELTNTTVLISLNGTIGNLAYYNFEKVVLGKSAGYITLKDMVNKNYVFFELSSNKVQSHFYKELTGATIKNLSLDTLRKTKIPIPPIVEQQKISSILSSVDEKIEITDNLIEKTKELKKGLMQTLLTKGIGHDRFKDTEIGRIPVEWEVRKLGEISEVKGGKRLPKGLQLIDYDNGFPYIRVADMYMGGINTNDIKYVPLEAVDKIKNYRIDKEDLFISVAGTIGIVGEVPESLDEANLTENADKLCNIKINKKYLLWVLQSEFIQTIINGEKTTNAQPKLALTRIKEFLLPIPSKDEQNDIASILSSVDEQIEQNESKKEKLQQLKKGLMQKLLTGKIRVK